MSKYNKKSIVKNVDEYVRNYEKWLEENDGTVIYDDSKFSDEDVESLEDLLGLE